MLKLYINSFHLRIRLFFYVLLTVKLLQRLDIFRDIKDINKGLNEVFFMPCSGFFFIGEKCHVGRVKFENSYIEETQLEEGENVMKSTLNTAQKKFVELMVDDILYTNEELAEACEVDVRTIYRWKRHEGITKAINEQADASLGQYIHQANRRLVNVIEEGSEHGQLKAIDMLYKSLGKYKEQADVTVNNNIKTPEERRNSLLSRLGK